MNRIAVARELMLVAHDLVAMDFPTQEALDKYLKEHPDADKSKHKVVKTKKEQGVKLPSKALDKFKSESAEERKKKNDWLSKFENLVRKGDGKMGMGMWTNAHMHYGQGLSPEEAAKKYLSWAKKKGSVARELMLVAHDLVAMDFPTQDAYDKYMKEHPDADKSKHKVVKYDPSDMDTHPFNLMRQRKNEEKMEKIRKWHKKAPGSELSVQEIMEYNQRKGKKSSEQLVSQELLKTAKALVADTPIKILTDAIFNIDQAIGNLEILKIEFGKANGDVMGIYGEQLRKIEKALGILGSLATGLELIRRKI